MHNYGTMMDGLVVAVVGVLLLGMGVCCLIQEWFCLSDIGDETD